MTCIVYDSDGRELYRYEPAWVRTVPPSKSRKMTKYEVWSGKILIATKYTKHNAQMLASGINKLQRKD